MTGKKPKARQMADERTAKSKRPKHRQIIRWDHKRDLLLLLAIDKVCKEEGVKIPYDKCGPEVAPSVTGNAIVQHLAKLRKKMEAEPMDSSQDDGANVEATDKSVKQEAKDDSSSASYVPDVKAVSKISTSKREPKRDIKKQDKGTDKKTKKKTTGRDDKGTSNKDHKKNLKESESKKRTKWWLEENDSGTDGEEYVAGGSSFVGRDEALPEDDGFEAESSDSSEEDRTESKVVVLHLPQEKYRRMMLILQAAQNPIQIAGQDTGNAHAAGPSSTYNTNIADNGLFADTTNMSLPLESVGVHPQPDMTFESTGMYAFNPTSFADQTAGYAPNMTDATGDDATIQYPFADLFGGSDPGFFDMNMPSFNPLDTDFEIAAGPHADIHETGSTLASLTNAQQAPAPPAVPAPMFHFPTMVPATPRSAGKGHHGHRYGDTLGGREVYSQGEGGRLEVSGHRAWDGQITPVRSPTTANHVSGGIPPQPGDDKDGVSRRDLT
ncbi:hypothetical protein MMC10_000008 [Thelotrema lepadinum]|nr:hypothetical protein [Thelotrema lepadinum]